MHRKDTLFFTIIDLASSSDGGGGRRGCKHRGQEWFWSFSGDSSPTCHLLHYWDYLLQISSNGENVIGESVTRHFTGEFSVYSMAVRPAGSGAATVWQCFDVKIALVQAQGCPNLYPGPPNRPQWNDHSFGCVFGSRFFVILAMVCKWFTPT